MTELWLSLAHRSQATRPGPAVFAPYRMPGSGSGPAGSRGQVGGGERERRRPAPRCPWCGCSLQGVGAGRQGGDPALQGPEGGRGGDQQQRAGHRADRRDLLGEVVFGGGVDGQVQAEAEQLALAAGEPVGEVAGVGRGGFGVRVVELAAVGAGAAPRFQPGPLAAQPGGGGRGRGDRLDVQGDVEAAGVGQQRLQPAGGDFGGVAGDREGRGVVAADPQVPGGDLDVRRPGHRVRGGCRAGRGGRGGAGCGSGSWQGPRAGDGLAGNSEPGGVDVGAGVGGGGEQGGDLAAVQRADGQVRCGQQPGGLGGALRGAQPAAQRRGRRRGRGGGARG